MSHRFAVTKRFTDGALEGMVITVETSVEFEVGTVVPPGAWTGGGYVVEAVERIA